MILIDTVLTYMNMRLRLGLKSSIISGQVSIDNVGILYPSQAIYTPNTVDKQHI
jgi:hypothetical protein